jgi:hypothetical protein
MPILDILREFKWHRDSAVFVVNAERSTVCDRSEPDRSEMDII